MKFWNSWFTNQCQRMKICEKCGKHLSFIVQWRTLLLDTPSLIQLQFVFFVSFVRCVCVWAVHHICWFIDRCEQFMQTNEGQQSLGNEEKPDQTKEKNETEFTMQSMLVCVCVCVCLMWKSSNSSYGGIPLGNISKDHREHISTMNHTTSQCRMIVFSRCHSLFR